MKAQKSFLRHFYRKKIPCIWQEKIDVWRGESQVFRPCFERTGVIFIHVPKAAGTSIAYALYGTSVSHRKARDFVAVSKKEFNKYFSFAFVRNPWDRAVSAYNFARQGGTTYVKPLPNDIYKSKLFLSFESFVMDWLPQADLATEDVVFAPQYEFLYDHKGNLLVDFVGKMENLKSDIDRLAKEIGAPIILQSLNRSERDKSSYTDYYNKKMINVVADIYEKDIQLFGYRY